MFTYAISYEIIKYTLYSHSNEEKMLKENLNTIFNTSPHKLVLSKPSKKSNEITRINVTFKGEYYQFEKVTEKHVFHENVLARDAVQRCFDYLEDDFRQLNAWGQEFEFNIKITKKGKIFFDKRKSDYCNEPDFQQHNRKKNYILKEGEQIAPLVDMGIFTKEGKVITSMYDKFRQINRFVEIIDDAFKDHELGADSNSDKNKLTIIDFGCGKSYLTFIMYYYFTEIKNMNIKMIGVDQNESLINQCNDAAEKYGYKNLHFEMGDINGFQYTDNVDMVISLHACDTATDYALYNAIKWGAKMIFSVPCCQHELNEQIQSDDFALFTRYGLIKERMAALMTDSIRANLLEVSGYKTQILEFIDMEHTPKNILLRAVKKPRPKKTVEKAQKEIENVISEFGLRPTLVDLLNLAPHPESSSK